MLASKDTWTHPYQEYLPTSLFQANRNKFLHALKLNLDEEGLMNSIAFFKGVGEVNIYNSDVNYQFHQEGNFYYLFGVRDEADCYGVFDMETGTPTLFVPKMSNLYKIWMTVLSAEDFKEKYGIEDVRYTEEMEKWLKERKPSKIYINGGINTDSGIPNIIPENKYWENHPIVDKEIIYELLANCRATKTD
jgi:Xaa-Pro dipeptidase